MATAEWITNYADDFHAAIEPIVESLPRSYLAADSFEDLMRGYLAMHEEAMAAAASGLPINVLLAMHEDPHDGVAGFSNTMMHIIQKFMAAILTGRIFVLDWSPPQEERYQPFIITNMPSQLICYHD